MKLYRFFPALFVLFSTVTLNAQHDDIYYDPSRDSRSTKTTTPTYRNNDSQSNRNYDNTSDYDNEVYEGEYYEYDDEYDDYYYASRIKRFHRPVRGFDYYDFAYSDYYYYDPFYYSRWNNPGVTVVFGGNSYWNNWNRFNRWNRAGWYDRYWNDYCLFNSAFYNPWSFGRPFGNYGGFGYYDPFFGNGFNNNFNGGFYRNNFNRYNNFGFSNNSNNGFGVNANNGRGKTYGPRANGTLSEPISPSGVANGNGRSQGSSVNKTPRTVDEARSRTSATESESGVVKNSRSQYKTESSDSRPTRSVEGANGSTVIDNERNTKNQRLENAQRTRERQQLSNDDMPTRTYEQRPRAERPNRSVETPNRSNDEQQRPTRTYEQRPSRQQERSAETPRQERSYEAPRQQRSYEAPQRTYEAPRQERSYEAPRSTPAPSRSESAPSNSGGSNNGGGNRRSGTRD
jgi:hypothetical protein